MSLLSPQCTCMEGSCTSWLKEVWLKDHRNFHSFERFVHQRTSLADVSLFSYMMLNTRNAMMKWVTHGPLCSVFESLPANTHIQPLSCHPLVLCAVLTPALPLKVRPGRLITQFFSHPTDTSQSTVHIPLLNTRTTSHRALQKKKSPNDLNN